MGHHSVAMAAYPLEYHQDHGISSPKNAVYSRSPYYTAINRNFAYSSIQRRDNGGLWHALPILAFFSQFGKKRMVRIVVRARSVDVGVTPRTTQGCLSVRRFCTEVYARRALLEVSPDRSGGPEAPSSGAVDMYRTGPFIGRTVYFIVTRYYLCVATRYAVIEIGNPTTIFER